MNYDKYEKNGAIHWDWYANPEHNYHKLVNESLKFLEGEKGEIIDVGSGDGLVYSLLLDKGFRVFGIEPNQVANKIAKEKIEEKTKQAIKPNIFQGTVEQFVSYECFSFDYLYSLNTIEHTKDPTSFVKLMKFCNKFGIIITDNAERNNRPNNPYHTKEFTFKELEILFKNFKTEELKLSNPNFIGIKIYANKT